MNNSRSFSKSCTAPVEEVQSDSKKKCRISPEHEAAIKRSQVSFPQLISAIQRIREAEGANECDSEYYNKMLEAFESTNGVVLEMYVCSHLHAAVALVKDTNSSGDTDSSSGPHFDLLFEYCFSDDSRVQSMLSDIRELRLESRNLLKQDELKNCLGYLFSAARSLLCLAECKDSYQRNREEMLALVNSQIEKARGYHDQYSKADAQLVYLKGVGMGTCFVGVPLLLYCIIALAVGGVSNITALLAHAMVFSALAGAVGAVVSVMSRLSRGELRCWYKIESKLLRYHGIFRPVLGAIFGLAIYVLLRGGWLPFTLENSQRGLFGYISFGFISGFSERWVRDMLLATETSILPSRSERSQEEVQQVGMSRGQNVDSEHAQSA